MRTRVITRTTPGSEAGAWWQKTYLEGESMWEPLRDKPVKTRKPHQCEWCAEVIEAGAAAHFRSFIGECGPQSGWSHPECWDAMTDSDYRDLQEGWSPGDFMRGKPSHCH